ncbi:hypothetical protein IW150_003166 [Coemansia sp. RSA 2607]|nr:hypothetical protein IW150_003166 [Coemansia sp. RSA 2607]
MPGTLYVPAKRRLAIDDPFFDQGNAESAVSFYLGDVLTSSLDCKQGGGRPPDTTESSLLLAIPETSIYCSQPPCTGQVNYPNALAFERHYDQVHANVCSQCGAILPNSHWLDLHVEECHDAFFVARVSRGDKAFLCFVKSCESKFVCQEERKAHMISVHHFAHSFDWEFVTRGLCTRTRDSEADASDSSEEIHTSINESQFMDSNIDMDIDEISTEFERSVRIRAPEKISFGRQSQD